MKPNAARVTLGPASGPSMVRSVHYLYADGTAGSELPLHHYRVDLTDGVLCGGDGALIFSAAWDDCADEEHRLTCCRADVPLLEYVNRTGQAVWVRNGLASFTLLAKGASVRLSAFPARCGGRPLADSLHSGGGSLARADADRVLGPAKRPGGKRGNPLGPSVLLHRGRGAVLVFSPPGIQGGRQLVGCAGSDGRTAAAGPL